MVHQRGWSAGAGNGTNRGTGREGMAASTADSSTQREVEGTLGCEEEDATGSAANVEGQSRSRTGVDAQETPSPASILRRPTETSAGCGDSSASAATKHHHEGDGVDDQLGRV